MLLTLQSGMEWRGLLGQERLGGGAYFLISVLWQAWVLGGQLFGG